jgi:hypothetical protein
LRSSMADSGGKIELRSEFELFRTCTIMNGKPNELDAKIHTRILDHLARSTRDSLEITAAIREASGRFQSLSEPCGYQNDHDYLRWYCGI